MVQLFAESSPYVIPGIVDLRQPSFWIAVGSICFNPLYWNIVAQNEYENKTITKVLGGRRYLGCYLLALSIFSLGILRDHLYNLALKEQPTHALLQRAWLKPVAALLFAAGNTFVLSSMWALGFTGTYLGDYFGILMDSIVTGFPFNVMANPMYWGSSMSFVAVALWFGKPAGLLLSVLVVLVYSIALRYEEPFTANIYRQAEKKNKRAEAEKQALLESEAPASGTRNLSRRTPSKSKA
ncbi:probable OPI3-methylene-fatty-acyl-phospholipid synthase [Ustilago bromivora]|uniref:Phosphatidyl-N-methylethanolamine N-methyltransferase n=1 Tax=Ustilago bromivora TaxID=307758 RepID=A0A1K0GBD6_9BASI|nr:probable OPI3-methylene-fatty-acyl-phospholipid synthase [Ustilago bromivora]SPC64562.1 probable OPI3 - methylene-fatty-acyl-phospholipid synthase [Ustilago sp. UG-2017b]SYW83502.1 probable OPI3 - methylene-fatty-acyl-phospholipid synthase [Ustilago bromivora]